MCIYNIKFVVSSKNFPRERFKVITSKKFFFFNSTQFVIHIYKIRKYFLS